MLFSRERYCKKEHLMFINVLFWVNAPPPHRKFSFFHKLSGALPQKGTIIIYLCSLLGERASYRMFGVVRQSWGEFWLFWSIFGQFQTENLRKLVSQAKSVGEERGDCLQDCLSCKFWPIRRRRPNSQSSIPNPQTRIFRSLDFFLPFFRFHQKLKHLFPSKRRV
jgi:hypothetical protein